MSKREDLLRDDLRDMSPLAKIALVIINDKPGINNTRLQKMAFLVDKIFHCGGEAESYFFGAFSEDLSEEVGTMIDDGTIVLHRNGYDLTNYGEELATMISSQEEDEFNFIQALHDFSDNEVLFTMYSLFPEYTDKSKIKGRISQSPRISFTKISKHELDKGETVISLLDKETQLSVKKVGGK